MAKNGYRSLKRIALLMSAQDGNCFYCDRPLSELEITVDHFDPLDRSSSNTVLACRGCNSSKHSRQPEEYGILVYLKYLCPSFATVHMPNDGSIHVDFDITLVSLNDLQNLYLAVQKLDDLPERYDFVEKFRLLTVKIEESK